MGYRVSGKRSWSLNAAVAITVCLASIAGIAPAAIAQPASTVDPAATATPTPTPEPTLAPTATPEPTATPTPTPTGMPSPPADEDDADDAVEADAPVAATMPAAGRIGGNDRYTRSILASKASFASGASTVLVASGEAEVGPIIAASMASRRQAPLLYVKPSGIPSAVATELRRLRPSRIVMVGSDADASQALITALKKIATVERIKIASRYEGSMIALAGSGTKRTVYVTGSNLLDLATATAAAASTGRGALMVNGTTAAPSAGVVNTLRGVGATDIVLVGGTMSVTSTYARALTAAGFAVSRRAPADIYELSRSLAKDKTSASTRVFVANPAITWDAATAAALAAATGQPMLYAPYQCMMTVSADYVYSIGAAVVGVGKPNWLHDEVVSNAPCATVKAKREAALTAAIRNTLAGYPGNYAVSVRELGRVGETIGIEDHSRLEPASMMKLFAAWATLRKIQDNRLTLDNSILPSGITVRTCLHVMIHVSDNFCHSDLVHFIGIGEVNRMLASAGFSETSYGSVPGGASILYAGNRTTTSDLTEFLMRLQRGELLNPSLTKLLLGEMGIQIWRSRIASGLPPGVVQQSKPGSLWIPSGLLQADSALVYGPQSTFALSVIGVDGPSKAAISAVARVVYSHVNEPFGTAKSYPVQQMVTKGPLAFREAPAGRVIGTMPGGLLVEVTDSNRIWYKVWWAGRLGWVDYRGVRDR